MIGCKKWFVGQGLLSGQLQILIFAVSFTALSFFVHYSQCLNNKLVQYSNRFVVMKNDPILKVQIPNASKIELVQTVFIYFLLYCKGSRLVEFIVAFGFRTENSVRNRNFLHSDFGIIQNSDFCYSDIHCIFKPCLFIFAIRP